jgi:hypothetical protein
MRCDHPHDDGSSDNCKNRNPKQRKHYRNHRRSFQYKIKRRP